MNTDKEKKQIVNDAKKANRIFNKAWGEGYDEVEIDLELLNRLISYARLLAMEIERKDKMYGGIIDD